MNSIDELRATLRTAASFSLERFVARLTKERHATTPGSPAGSLLSAGRYNRRGHPALYTSYDARTALEEILVAIGYNEGDPFEPYMMHTFWVAFTRVFDLTDATLLSALGTSYAEVTSTRFPGIPHPCQMLGEAARAEGAEALVAWSAARPGEKNVVIFAVDPPRYVTVTGVTSIP